MLNLRFIYCNYISEIFFYQVTNQMVTACRSYITDNGTVLIWDQDAEDLIRKIQVMMTLTWGISIKSVLLFMRFEYNTSACDTSGFFLAGLHLLVSEVSVLLPEDKDTVNGKTWKEVLWDFRVAHFWEVWRLLQATWKGTVQANFKNLNPLLL